jgi:hypothetical protein
MNQLTINIETDHRSLILILGSSSSLSSNYFTLILLRLEERIKGWDKWIRQLGRVSSLTGTRLPGNIWLLARILVETMALTSVRILHLWRHHWLIPHKGHRMLGIHCV